MWYCDCWKTPSSSRMHSLMRMPRACWSTISCLSCGGVSVSWSRGEKKEMVAGENSLLERPALASPVHRA